MNGLHAAAAFIGLREGHETVAEAVSDPSIRGHLEEITETMAAALSADSDDWRRDELASYGRYNLERFETTTLVDPIRRVARNPLRKLGPTERLVGPAKQALRKGLPVDSLCDAIVAGLAVNDPEVPGSEELRDALSASGWRSVVGLGAEDEPLLEMLENRLASQA